MKRQNSDEEELILREPYSSCERQVCASSPPNIPIRRYKYDSGRMKGEFQREDFGCWRIYVGKTPERICEDDCWCSCHTTGLSKMDRAWNEDWVNKVEELKQKWRKN